MHWLDTLHATLRNDGAFFTDGWGDESILALPLVQPTLPPLPYFNCLSEIRGEHLLQEYRFPSPHPERPLPPESQQAYFRMVLPKSWTLTTPICLHLACTGDQGYDRRYQILAKPLLQYGIGSVILENPFYGIRRPKAQQGTYVRTVSDLWLMGMTATAEARTILVWLHQSGFQRLGVSGISMGGQIASHVASLHPQPLATCCCIAPYSATPVFLEGVLSNYTAWSALHKDKLEAQHLLKAQLDKSALKLFPSPIREDACLWIAASHDAYVPPSSCQQTQQTWPQSSLRWVNSGHISSVIFRRKAFLQGILDAFTRIELPVPERGGWLP